MELVAWSRSQRRHVRWSGRRDATSAQNRGPWPKTRRWASSWMTTVSSASGGARINRHENASAARRATRSPTGFAGRGRVIACGRHPERRRVPAIARSISALARA